MVDWPYNSAQWRRLRKRKLAFDPLCYPCNLRGRTVAAVAVDHIISIRSGGPVFPPLDGLMSMCLRCHAEKTNAVDRPDRRGTGRAIKGCDVDGNPIDPTDAWHGEGGVKDQKRPTPVPVPYSQIDLFNPSNKKGGG